MPIETNSVAEKITRLQSWQPAAGGITTDHMDVVRYATAIATRYISASRSANDAAARIASKVCTIALTELNRGDRAGLSVVRRKMEWWNSATDSLGVPPVIINLPIEKIADDLKAEIQCHRSFNYNGVLHGKPGINACVLIEGSNNKYKFSKHSQVSIRYGSEFVGDPPPSKMPIDARVHLTGSNNRTEVDGHLKMYVGAEIGINKSWKSEAVGSLVSE